MTTPRNILLLYAARGVRGFGDGFATITLPAYLIAIGYDPVRIGLIYSKQGPGASIACQHGMQSPARRANRLEVSTLPRWLQPTCNSTPDRRYQGASRR